MRKSSHRQSRRSSKARPSIPKLPSDLPSKSAQFDEVVRHTFGLGPPKMLAFRYGWSKSDVRFGEFRDEQAWMLEAEYADSKGRPEDLQLVTVRLHPGVSRREARKAADRAMEFFRQKVKGKRPGLLPRERDFMNGVFVAVTKYVHKPVPPKMMAEITALFLKGHGYNRSLKTISREYRRWRFENQFHVKRYTTEKRDAARRGQIK